MMQTQRARRLIQIKRWFCAPPTMQYQRFRHPMPMFLFRSASKAARVPLKLATPAQTCFHCGLPVPAEVDERVSFDGQPHAVCCSACAAVMELVIANGYGDYYRERERLAATA